MEFTAVCCYFSPLKLLTDMRPLRRRRRSQSIAPPSVRRRPSRRRSGSRANSERRESRESKDTNNLVQFVIKYLCILKNTQNSTYKPAALLFLNISWWTIHVAIGVTILCYQSTVAHNVVAACLIWSEFSTQRTSIFYIFEESDPKCSIALNAYLTAVSVIAVILLMFMAVISMLITMVYVGYLLLVVFICLSLFAIVFRRVQVVSFVLISAPFTLLLFLGTCYFQLGFIFVPCLYSLIIAVAAVEYLISADFF